ncbi:MAG: cysteine synthase family protein [Defluviitaleaceae bacterium]|nr:cysteine synthase family protein [Defluviitaleaceae bacterium]
MANFMTSITQAIGQTPLLRLDKIKKHFGFEGNIFAKLENMNPSSSKKDRIALGMIEEAERKGFLKPGGVVLEMSSGNTGTGVAMVCSAKGYRLICVLSRGNSTERAKMIEAFGGELVYVDQAPNSKPGEVSGEDIELVEAEALRLVEETGAYFIDQFNNFDNALSQEAAAREMWEQSGGQIEAFADFIGTGGTFTGYSRTLKGFDPNIKCYAVEPYECAHYKGEVVKGATHRIQGGGYAKHMEIVDVSLIDGCITVTDNEAERMTRMLAKKEGIFAGFSSGTNLVAAIKQLKGADAGKNFGIVINDCGLKYMSTNLYSENKCKEDCNKCPLIEELQ